MRDRSPRNLLERGMATNVVWHRGEVDPGSRRRAYGHGGAMVWLTGLSGSGKSTVAHRVEALLVGRSVASYTLDGDNLRHGLNADLGFAAKDRSENVRRVSEVGRLFADAGVVVLAAFVSPYRRDRDAARDRAEELPFFEVWVATPLEVCEARDPKGLYRRARRGEIPEFTGVSAPYEEPTSPELVLQTHQEGVDESARRVIRMLEASGVVSE